jgi:hypothetical protein
MKTTTRQLKTTSTGTNMFIFLHENRDFWDISRFLLLLYLLCISILTSHPSCHVFIDLNPI